ncbi:MAG: NADH:flavin oxidoreductase [Candidatus Riflebacteria bacterium]|nr:NADH:flavin oxidoreductase [Candidatus Riflebacteria bacterium]
MYSNLFSPFKIRNKILKNRIFVAAMATQYADKYGFVSDAMVDYYVHMSLTGVAAIFVEAAVVSSEGRGWSRQLSATSKEALPGLSRIAEAISERGPIPFLQLHHAGRQALPTGNSPVVAPSGIPCPVLNRKVRVLSPKEIGNMVEKFTFSASLAQEAGFAGIELHGAHGYLLHQFVSPLTNKRDDEYGLQNSEPFKFPLAVVRSIKINFPKMLLIYRISARDYLPKGLTLDKSLPLVKRLLENGVDVISVSGGMYQSLHGPDSILGPATDQGFFRQDAKAIKLGTNAPTGVTGKIQYPSLAEEILKNAEADLIGLGRPILRDPNWLWKTLEKEKGIIRECLLCERCNYHRKGCPDDAEAPIWTK